jgi:acetyl-CoA acetyltransferase
VLIVAGDNRVTGMSRDGAVAALSEVGHQQFERPYGISVPASYALVARAYMHEYGATPEHLAAIAVQHREHAARHPKAHKREVLTIADVMASRIIASPLRLYDCCLISDGGAALVVSAADAAADTPQPRVDVLGCGQGHTHEHISQAPSLSDFGCKQSSAIAFGKAGVTARDIDVAEIYDSFTITLLVELESIGFFERGAAGPAALDGAPGSMFHIVEAVHQLRGTADVRQVKNAGLAFVHGDGGILSAHCSAVLGRV